MKRESFLLLSVLIVSVLSQESLSRVQGVTVTRTVQGSSPALRVSWSAVSGSGITYIVCYSTTSGTQSDPPPGANCGASGITGTATTLSPVSRSTTYYIWVRAVSSGRRGPYSDRTQQRACNVPSRPTLLAVFYKLYLPSEVGISVTWSGPQSDCPITSYEVQYKISSDTSWSTPPVSKSRSTRHDWRGLSPNTSYDVRVKAVSAAGKGAWSDVGQVTTPGVPGPVRSLSVTPIAVNGVPALHVRWSPPVDKAGGGLTYRLRVVPPHVTISRPVTATEYIVTGLRANTRYTVYVSARSSGVYGPEVSIATTTVGTPGPVRSLSATPIAVNGVPVLRVRWSPPVDKAGGGLTYRLRVVPPHVTISRPVTATEYNVTGLRANTRYTVYVRAVSSGVYGPEESDVDTTGGNFSAVSPTLFRKITLPSRLAVVLVWSVPASVANDVDGFVISVVMVTASGPSTIQRSTARKRVRAYAVYFPERGASYQVTVHMTMNGLHSGPLTVEVNF